MVGVSGERVNLLKDRARVFLELAEELRGRGRLDLAMFNVDQAFQLRVKATMLRLLGVIPRIHGVRGLLGMLVRRLAPRGGDGSYELHKEV
ncbi:MAG: HEPN domain containing protein [Candidatus Bathyarchaeota archaeon B24]|nr:MAG: HEPN domain containing protein [Candidatus Bathyarchaeota archaeon B24]